MTKKLFSFKQVDAEAWSLVIQHLKAHRNEKNKICIPVTKESFDFAEINDMISRNYSWCCISDDSITTINEFINAGYIHTHETMLNDDDTIEARYCLDRGFPPDEDRFGEISSTWLIAKLDLKGNFIKPFHLSFGRYI
jgi:hypothetical protein